MPTASTAPTTHPPGHPPGTAGRPPRPSRRPRRGGPLALAAVVVAAALALAGCGGGSSSSKGSGLSGVTVTAGAAGAAPNVKVASPLKVTKTQREVLSAGKGTKAKTGSAVVARFVGVNGRTGKVFGSDYGSTPVSFILGDKVIKGFADALDGVRAGSRVVAKVSPADGYGPRGGVADLKIKKTDSLVYVIDVLGVTGTRATGTAVTPPAGLPAVALGKDGAPTVTVPAGVAAPTSLVSQTLIQGTGPVVAKGQYITVQYTGVVYGTGKVFDSSWTSGTPATFQIGTGQVIPGWDTALVGAKVGSQLLLVVPPAQGYGSTGNTSAGITGTDTLVFVVDVLAATT